MCHNDGVCGALLRIRSTPIKGVWHIPLDTITSLRRRRRRRVRWRPPPSSSLSRHRHSTFTVCWFYIGGSWPTGTCCVWSIVRQQCNCTQMCVRMCVGEFDVFVHEGKRRVWGWWWCLCCCLSIVFAKHTNRIIALETRKCRTDNWAREMFTCHRVGTHRLATALVVNANWTCG